MYIFDLNWRYNQPIVSLIVVPIVAPIVAPIVGPIEAPIHIKHVHSSASIQWTIYPKYDRRGRELPSGYGALMDVHCHLTGPLDICHPYIRST